MVLIPAGNMAASLGSAWSIAIGSRCRKGAVPGDAGDHVGMFHLSFHLFRMEGQPQRRPRSLAIAYVLDSRLVLVTAADPQSVVLDLDAFVPAVRSQSSLVPRERVGLRVLLPLLVDALLRRNARSVDAL